MNPGDGADATDEDREWRFSLDEVGPDADEDDSGTADESRAGGGAVRTPADDADADPVGESEIEGEGEGEGALGTFAPSKTIEPESIGLENALFVVLGVVLTVALLWYLFT